MAIRYVAKEKGEGRRRVMQIKTKYATVHKDKQGNRVN